MNQETDNSHERRPSFLSVETDKSDSLLENNPLTHRQAFKKVSSNEEHQIDDDDEHSVQVNIPPSVSSIATPKKTMRQKVSAKIPKVPQIRKTLKAAIALGIALVFVFDMRIRRAVGDSVLLHAIVTIFFFPVRTIGKLFIWRGVLTNILLQVSNLRYIFYLDQQKEKTVTPILGHCYGCDGWIDCCCMEFSR